jgi:hypothetical protein
MEWIRDKFGGPFRALAACMVVLALCGALVSVDVQSAVAQDTSGEVSTAEGTGDPISGLGGIFGEIFQTDTELLFAMIAPGFIVYALGVVIQPSWSSKLKQAVTYAVCFAVAVAFLYIKGGTVWSWDGAPRYFVVLAVIARGYYQMYKGPVVDVENSSALNKGP